MRYFIFLFLLLGRVCLAIDGADAAYTDRLIVKYKDISSRANSPAISSLLSDRRQRLIANAKPYGADMVFLRNMHNNAQVMKLSRMKNVFDVRELARRVVASDPLIEYAVPDYRSQALQFPYSDPDDPLFVGQWALARLSGYPGAVNSGPAWRLSSGRNVNVGVIDTGYLPHADIASKILPGYDMISYIASANDGDARDPNSVDSGDYANASCSAAGTYSSWHGTGVASVIAAVSNNGAGMAGLAYAAKVVPVRVLGACGAYDSDIADSIVWAAGLPVSGLSLLNPNPVRIINMSLGGEHACTTVVQGAINQARTKGVAIVVAAGNSKKDVSGFSPASCQGVIAVASDDSTGARSAFSNYGALIDVAAPGSAVTIASNAGQTIATQDNFLSSNGTSFSAPYVTAVAALILQIRPQSTPDEVETFIKSTTRSSAACSGCGTGLLDAGKAVGAALYATRPWMVPATSLLLN